MNEAFLSFIWKFRLYHPHLISTSGEQITVDSAGEQHNNSGPDFFNARIRIGSTLWAGNVEIHSRASDWYRHSHQLDDAYTNVILHVVYEADADIILNDQRVVPTLELKGFMKPEVHNQYFELARSTNSIPCSHSLSNVPSITVQTWLDRMLVERLEQRADAIQEALHVSGNDYEQAFYEILAGGFGFHINALPFTMLTRILPYKLLRKHAGDILLCEALVYGQAGMLNESADETIEDAYFRELRSHYKFLSGKYKLLPLDAHLWKFLRMRPVNFPTIRLSQFTELITTLPALFRSFLDASSSNECMELLNVKASAYWDTHYVFGKPAPGRQKRLGRESAVVLLINTVAPFLFMYGKWSGDESHCRKALDLISALPAEKNRIIQEWKLAGLNCTSAYDSQAAIGLYKNYCIKKNCLICSIGTAILRNSK
ncbi:MAG TPA: DUF2851 family protein [Bacteroidia bacterium]|nr:DUF2851 family protein [Bacteroidia bacterium]